MRQFDTYQSYLDNLGELLVGRLRFCTTDGTISTIYDSDGDAIENPILTDNTGRTARQVFLDDHDYLVFFEKYVGNAVISEDTEDDSWEEIGSSINRYNTVGVEVNVDGGIQSVDTIADLKALNPGTNANYIIVKGYNEAGDKPAVTYVWKNGSTKTVDGGSVISSDVTSNGRWIIVPNFTEVDVRHFGAFPKASPVDDYLQRYAISSANAFALKNGLDLFFHADDSYYLYDISGLTLTNVNCSDKAMLYNVNNDNSYLNNVKKVFCKGNITEDATGKTYITGTELRTSYNATKSSLVFLTPSEKLIFDTDYIIKNLSVSDVECVLLVNQSMPSATYTNCTFSGSGTLPKEKIIHLVECEVHQSMFEDYDAGYVNCTDCYTSISEWTDMLKYINFMMDCGNNDIDLYNKDVTGDLDFDGKDFYLRNTQVTGTITCKNFRGTNMSATKVIAESYSFNNCTASVAGDLGSMFIANDSTITLYEKAWIYGAAIRRSTFGTNSWNVYFAPNSQGTIANVYITDTTIQSNLVFTPYQKGADEPTEDIYVNNFVFVGNQVKTFFTFESSYTEDASGISVVDKSGQYYFALTQGYYKIEDNVNINGLYCPSTRLDKPYYTFAGGKWFRYENPHTGAKYLYDYTDGGARDGEKYLCLKRVVWSFGEDKNHVNYGCDKIHVEKLDLDWYCYSSGQKVEGKWYLEDEDDYEDGYDVKIYLSSDGYSHIDQSFYPQSEFEIQEGTLEIEPKDCTTSFTFRPIETIESLYDGWDS